MLVKIQTKKSKTTSRSHCYFVFQDQKTNKFPKELDSFYKAAIKNKSFTGKSGELLSVNTTPSHTLLIIGLGKKKKSNANQLRDAGAALIQEVKKRKEKSLYLDTTSFSKTDLNASLSELIEGMVMGNYIFNGLKSDPKPDYKPTLYIESDKDNEKPLKQSCEAAIIKADGTNLARDLANSPANHMTPEIVLNTCKKQFKGSPVKVSAITEKEAHKKGLHSFLSVGQGSDNPSYMAIMSYLPNKKQNPIVLVGKGITFDSGGISIKPSGGMHKMKGDMGGAAAVIGAMSIIAKLKPKQNVIAITPLAENLPSSKALKPGDVIKALNGKTIEVLNTDAEGRLVLADALCVANEKKASEIIDIATLTGACIIALGSEAAAFLGNTPTMIKAVQNASETSGETIWQLPLFEGYLDNLKSDCADLANVSEDRGAGTAIAAKFLEQFVGDTPWTHVDIASKMSYKSTKGHEVKGMSGFGARLLADYVLSKSN